MIYACRVVSLSLFVLLIFSKLALAQGVCQSGFIYNSACDRNPQPKYVSVASRVAQALCNGYCNIDLVENPTVSSLALSRPAAVATGRDVISYEPNFLANVYRQLGDNGVFGVIAHEVGHIIDSRTRAAFMMPAWGGELRADAWAGCALARAGLTTVETSQVLLSISQFPTHTHPAWNLRIPALNAGYQGCGGAGELVSTEKKSEKRRHPIVDSDNPEVRRVERALDGSDGDRATLSGHPDEASVLEGVKMFRASRIYTSIDDDERYVLKTSPYMITITLDRYIFEKKVITNIRAGDKAFRFTLPYSAEQTSAWFRLLKGGNVWATKVKAKAHTFNYSHSCDAWVDTNAYLSVEIQNGAVVAFGFLADQVPEESYLDHGDCSTRFTDLGEKTNIGWIVQNK